MELSNRDSNFNRVFSTQQPLTVDPRAGKIGMSSQQVIASHKSNEPLKKITHYIPSTIK
jgi:hypothetical protein